MSELPAPPASMEMNCSDRPGGVAEHDVTPPSARSGPLRALYSAGEGGDSDIAHVHPTPRTKSTGQNEQEQEVNSGVSQPTKATGQKGQGQKVNNGVIQLPGMDDHVSYASQEVAERVGKEENYQNNTEQKTQPNINTDSGSDTHLSTANAFTGSESTKLEPDTETAETSVESDPNSLSEPVCVATPRGDDSVCDTDHTEGSVATLQLHNGESRDLPPQTDSSRGPRGPEGPDSIRGSEGPVLLVPRVVGAESPPPSYEEATGGRHIPLTYVDFVPKVHADDGMHEKFEVLVTRANEWLSANPGYRVKNCECLELSVSGPEPEVDFSVYTEPSYFYRKYLRALRLWLRYSADEAAQPAERIHQINIVPPITDRGGTQGYPTFLPLDRTLIRFNAKLRTQHIPGRILNIVTQENLLKSGKTPEDPDTTLCEESERYNYYYYSLKVFFVEGDPSFEEVGYEDFVPALVNKTTQVFQLDEYEKIGEVVARAGEWLSEQHDKRVTNIQTVDFKGNEPVKKRQQNAVDTHTSSRRTTHEEKSVVYLRFVRVYFTRVFYGDLPPVVTPSLQYKTFVPCKTHDAGYLANDEFEAQSDTMERAIEWLNSAGIASGRLLSVETVGVRLYGGNQEGDPEQSLTLQSGGGIRSFLRVFRVFIDGTYQEPLPTLLKAPPEVLPARRQCCSLQ